MNYFLMLKIDNIIPVSTVLTPEAQKTTIEAAIQITNPKIEDLPPCRHDEVNIRDRLNPILLPG